MEQSKVKKELKNSIISLVKGDITDMDIDAFVYDIKENLVLGAGFGNAISVRGGPAIQEELNKLEKISIGQAVITQAGTMKAKFIIHTVGPKFQEEGTKEKLRDATLSALKKAEEKKEIQRLAFPPMGTGLYGVPLDLCANTMLTAVKEHLEGSTTLKEVVFCVLDSREYGPFRKRLETL
jgi:O-acetyl-ADP-ribose deacetylase (regulator of RNase III)